MEKQPKYKVGQKVWFTAENGKICYGSIVFSAPVGYLTTYTIKMHLNSVGEVTKQNVWESEIIGDFSLDNGEVCARAAASGNAKEVDPRIVESMVTDANIKVEKKKNPTGDINASLFADRFRKQIMGTIEPLYDYGLERDFGPKCDLAFIMGAIVKYGKDEGFYGELGAYLMNMVFAFIRDLRKEVVRMGDLRHDDNVIDARAMGNEELISLFNSLEPDDKIRVFKNDGNEQE